MQASLRSLACRSKGHRQRASNKPTRAADFTGQGHTAWAQLDRPTLLLSDLLSRLSVKAWSSPSSSLKCERGRPDGTEPKFETETLEQKNGRARSWAKCTKCPANKEPLGKETRLSGLALENYSTGRPDELDRGLSEAFAGLVPWKLVGGKCPLEQPHSFFNNCWIAAEWSA